MRKKVTLRNVAQLAGVSVATASYALNNSDRQQIAPETKQRILDAARSLGYMPNLSARSLKSARCGCIGVVIDKDITVQRYAMMLQGIRSVLTARGQRLMLCSAQNHGTYPDYLASYYSGSVDGLIYIGVDSCAMDPAWEQIIVREHIPVVAFECRENPAIPSVRLDYRYGAAQMTEYLLNRGFSQLYYVRPSADTRQEQDRQQGVVETASARGAEVQILPVFMPVIGEPWESRQNFLCQLHETLARQKDSLAGAAEMILTAMKRKDPRGSRTAVICSWGGMDLELSRFFGPDAWPQFASLALSPWMPLGNPPALYSVLPNFRAGAECARMILDLLDGACAPEHQVLRPGIGAEERME